MTDTLRRLAIGGIYTATLHTTGSPWTIHGTATVWAAEHRDSETWVTLQLSDAPSARRRGHTAYARGRVNILTDGRREVVRVLTPQPGPDRITLGWNEQGQRHPDDAEHHTEQAAKELADWATIEDDDSPLGVSALTRLARAVQRVTEGETAARERDQLVRRLRAGGVPRDLVAQTDGRDPSRITQICKPREKMSA